MVGWVKERIYNKDAGFVYKSLRNDTNRVFWDFWPYELNPRYESFEKVYESNPQCESYQTRSTKQNHNTNLLNTVWIRMDSHLIYVLRFVRIRWIRENRSNLLKIGWICMYDTKRIFPSSDSWTSVRKESGIRIVRYESNLFEVRIRTHDTVRIHVFKNLFYDSRILNI